MCEISDNNYIAACAIVAGWGCLNNSRFNYIFCPLSTTTIYINIEPGLKLLENSVRNHMYVVLFAGLYIWVK